MAIITNDQFAEFLNNKIAKKHMFRTGLLFDNNMAHDWTDAPLYVKASCYSNLVRLGMTPYKADSVPRKIFDTYDIPDFYDIYGKHEAEYDDQMKKIVKKEFNKHIRNIWNKGTPIGILKEKINSFKESYKYNFG